MKRVVLWLLALLLTGSVSCGRQEGSRRYFAYLDTPAKATLTGHVNSLAFSAVLETQGRNENGSTDAKLTFTSPESLSGVCLVCRDGVWSASLGSLTGENGAGGLGRIPALLIEERAVRSTKAEGETVALTLSDGARLILDKKTGVPLRAEWSDGHRAIDMVIVEWES
ncbi:MAG: hypothetical protein E7625_06185 [Ruminococcaceae bacterium]|nr:hypothetical protein [Oscillospiraceae bacterium]